MNNQQLYQRARQIIPGGTQLLSKRPEMHAPGYANEHVDAAVLKRIRSGTMCSLNSPDEVELAELLIDLHPWADMVRYARTGGESLAVAVRIARAATGRKVIAFCGYHGWSDWYLAANLSGEKLGGHLLNGLDPSGVPSGLEGTVLPFQYGDLDALRRIVSQNKLAAIVMEPVRGQLPASGFLEGVRQVADDAGAALVFDEVSSGWKFACGGAHMKFGIEPDVAVFSKSTSNGYPMSAVIGRASVMEAAQTSFISSTYWTDGIGPAAAIASIRQMQKVDVPAHLAPPFVHLGFDHPETLALQTLFTIRMLDRGYLAGSSFYPTLSHTEQHVDDFAERAADVLDELGDAVRKGDLESRLTTPIRHTGFQRLT